MIFNLSRIPFSRYGSYTAVSELPDNWRGYNISRGIYIKTVGGGANIPIAARLIFPGGAPHAELEGGSLSLTFSDYRYDLCFADPETLLIRGSVRALLTIDFMTENGPYDYVYERDLNGAHCYFANCYKNNTSFVIHAQAGEIKLDQRWREQTSEYSRLIISGEDGFLIIIKEARIEFDGICSDHDFEACRAQTAREFAAFCGSYPDMPDGYKDMSILGAYVNWSAYVLPRGFLTRPAMLMSKNHMTSVWSWDHCFNALALSYKNHDAAWEQFMLMFDLQDKTGRLPDSVNDSCIVWNYVKPPVHGWTLMRMLENGMTLTESRLAEAYHALEKQMLWWINYRDFDGGGLCGYTHGNDSGWDNSTVFSDAPPICAPDLQAFLIIQADALSELSKRLNMPEKSDMWRLKSKEMSETFFDKCFIGGLPAAFKCGTRSVIENQSLLPYLCLILGERIPEEYRRITIESLKTGGFISRRGFATESLYSPAYRSDGYWRGPVWAPSTVIICDGLRKCGETDLAKDAAEKFLEMCKRSGFAENFDAKSGEGLRDRAYTWTSSAAFILAREYLT